jgi:AraC-like DNA-binding protein
MTSVDLCMTAHNFTVATHFFQLLSDYIAKNSLSPHDLLREADMVPSDIQADSNGRIPFAIFTRLCEVAARLLGDPRLGLKLGQSVRPGHLGSHGFALMSCSTTMELAKQSERYSALTIDAGHNVVEHRGKEFVRVFRSNIPGQRALGELQDEMQHAIAVTLVRYITNREDLNPAWVSFQHARPADTRDFEALFRCPVYFGANETAIGIDAQYMNLPLPHGNAQVLRMMDDLSAQLSRQLGDSLEPNWLAAARQAALKAFRTGVPDVDTIAQEAGMGVEELKEQLTARGMSFRGFIDDLRQALALGYMRDPQLGLVDIAYLLGFSEQSAFQRAFKRWTGMTPGDYRRR